MCRRKAMCLSVWAVLLVVHPVVAQMLEAAEPTDSATSVSYQLLEGSTLTVDWRLDAVAPPTGEPPTLLLPIEGAFTLEAVPSQAKGTRRFVVDDFAFKPKTHARYYGHGGYGKYWTDNSSADPAQQEMSLRMAIDRCATIAFESGQVSVPEGIALPWIDIELDQVYPDDTDVLCPHFTLRLVAIPKPRVWFSTEVSFTPSTFPTLQKVSDGDLLSAAGYVVQYNRELMDAFGPIFATADGPGLDAVVVVPSEESAYDSDIWFSLETDVKNEGTLLQEGDLLSDVGCVVRRNAHLIAPFSPMPPITDMGLDAAAVYPSPEGAAYFTILFSTEKRFFSERLGVTVSHGDLLDEVGKIFKTNAALMKRFKPLGMPEHGLGLDAAYVWRNGEVWFSTEVDFVDARYGRIKDGDLLSDRGYVVMRNQELMARFSPLEDLDDFGLDALWVDTRPHLETCGHLVRGVECMLFETDNGERYLLGDYGGFGIGDRVAVSGIVNPSCFSFCMQGDGCIEETVISKCDDGAS